MWPPRSLMGSVKVWVWPPSVTWVASMKRLECWSKVRDEETARVDAPVMPVRGDSCIMWTAICGESARASRVGAGERNSFGVESSSLGGDLLSKATRSTGWVGLSVSR